jgi:hypothetical protein
VTPPTPRVAKETVTHMAGGALCICHTLHSHGRHCVMFMSHPSNVEQLSLLLCGLKQRWACSVCTLKCRPQACIALYRTFQLEILEIPLCARQINRRCQTVPSSPSIVFCQIVFCLRSKSALFSGAHEDNECGHHPLPKHWRRPTRRCQGECPSNRFALGVCFFKLCYASISYFSFAVIIKHVHERYWDFEKETLKGGLWC